jgi:recombination protein RecA
MAPKEKGAGQGRSASGSGPDLAALYKAIGKKTGVNVYLAVDMAPAQWLSTGMPLVDLALGGGIPRGRITHIWGDSSTGKSAIGLWLVKQQQSVFPNSAIFYVDTEKALGLPFVSKLGVNPATLGIGDPKTVEETFDFVQASIELAISAGVPGEQILVIWDSLAATVTAIEEASDHEDKVRPGTLAASISRGLKKIRPTVVSSGASFVILNQCRTNIGVMYGEKTQPCGGLATKFYSDLSVRTSAMTKFKHGENMYGIKVGLKVDKSRVGVNMGRKTRFHIYFVAGVLTDLPEFYDELKIYGLARNSGAQIKVGEDTFANKEAFVQRLEGDFVYRQGLVDLLSKEMLVGKVVCDDGDADAVVGGEDAEPTGLDMSTLAGEDEA